MPGRKALASCKYYFFFFAGLSAFFESLAFSGLLSAFLADFFGSASFFLSFLSEDLESAEAAADFFSGEDFLSFKSLLAFEASSFFAFLLVFSHVDHLSECAGIGTGPVRMNTS